MTSKLPAADGKEDERSGGREGGRFLAINHLHYHANDISELRKLAEVSPGLAEKVIDQRDRENARISASYNLGLVVSVVLLAFILIAFTFMVIFAGVLETLLAVAGILAVALLVRVVLTGEWSDTSWLGKIIHAIFKALGGKTDDDAA